MSCTGTIAVQVLNAAEDMDQTQPLAQVPRTASKVLVTTERPTQATFFSAQCKTRG